jgi:putative peptide zinc metalloprotease protein
MDLLVGEPDEEDKVVIFDPTAGRNYRVSAVTLHILRTFDGNRTRDEVHAALGREGLELAPDAFGAMVERAASNNFFEGIENAPAATIHTQGPSRRNPFFFQLFEFDPARLLRWAVPAIGWIFSPIAVALFAVITIVAVVLVFANGERYVNSLYSFGDIRAWIVVYVCAIGLTLLHESAHAVAVVRYGGTSRRMGLSLYLLNPVAYADTSDAYRFPRIRDRVVVSLAGIYIEAIALTLSLLAWASDWFPLFLASCFFLLAHYLAARVLLNLNPFLRLDGYWVATDLLRITNLRSKSFAYLVSRASPFRADRSMRGVARTTEERLFFTLYGVVALLMTAFALVAAFALLRALLRSIGIDPGATVWILAAVVVAAAIWGSWRYVISLRGSYSSERSGGTRAP